jgi:hypothetical protein
VIGESGRAGGRYHRALVRVLSVGGAVLVALSAVACVNKPPRSAIAEPRRSAIAEPRPISAEDFNARNFSAAAHKPNQWFPLTPGTRFFFKGSSIDEGERISHAVDAIVTDLTKVIAGVRTTVVWERDYTEGELEEAEIAFFAQDDDGNVWHLGEYPEEYDQGKIVKTPAWLAGLDGATAGIAMMAEPQLGTPDYAQGYAPRPINWADRARVYETDQRTCVPVDCYENVLVTEEFELAKPGSFQLKYYASGVGNVRVGWRGKNEKEREELFLVDYEHLSPEEMAKARAGALKLDARAYELLEALYGQTEAAQAL